MAKILIISDNYVPLLEDKVLGGAEATLMNQLAILTEKGHDVKVIAPDDSTINLNQLIPIGDYSKLWYNEAGSGAPRTLNKSTIKAINDQIALFKPDLVLNHHKQPSVIKHLAIYAKKVKIISHVHNAPIYGMLSLNTNKAYAELAKAGGHNWGVSGWCSRMNNNLVEGCVTDTFLMQIALERKTAVLPEYQGVVIGRFVDWKNLHFGIKPIVTKAISGMIVGYAEDQENEYWLNKIKPLVEGSEEWKTGITYKETMDILSKANVFIQTSHLETSSCTQFEAAQHGVPSIIVHKGNGHGSTEGSFLPEDAYLEINSYRKGEAYVSAEIIHFTKMASLQNWHTTVERRQALADYIYDNFNKEAWYNRFVLTVGLKTGVKL